MASDPADILPRLRSGEACVNDPCRVKEAASGCLCAAAADEIERLRAMVATRTVNINANVRVILTDLGRDRWIKNQMQIRARNLVLGAERLAKLYPLKIPLDSDGFYRSQLWALFQTFPPDPAMPSPFVAGSIFFDADPMD